MWLVLSHLGCHVHEVKNGHPPCLIIIASHPTAHPDQLNLPACHQPEAVTHDPNESPGTVIVSPHSPHHEYAEAGNMHIASQPF